MRVRSGWHRFHSRPSFKFYELPELPIKCNLYPQRLRVVNPFFVKSITFGNKLLLKGILSITNELNQIKIRTRNIRRKIDSKVDSTPFFSKYNNKFHNNIKIYWSFFLLLKWWKLTDKKGKLFSTCFSFLGPSCFLWKFEYRFFFSR